MKPDYQREGVTLYCADCRDVLPVECDLCFTDPPYKHAHVDGGGFAAASKFYREGALDGMQGFCLEDYWPFLARTAPMLIAFHSRDLIPDYAGAARGSGRSYDLHVWHKTNAIPFTANTWKSDLEYLALIWNSKPGWQQLPQHMHSKAYISPINRDDAHPAAKPIPLLLKYLQVLVPKSVIDPFMGSGTCAVACMEVGIDFVGIEQDNERFATAVHRIEQAFDGVSPAERKAGQKSLFGGEE